jgi:2-polyprenyl-3-methyl-5-hydroxy-6-metoxy-1,4-benzoquinol methylase
MGIGTAVRHRLGRWEVPAAEFYRSLFIDLDHLAATLRSLLQPKRILEIGCGEGALAERLVRAYPQAAYTGIDTAPAAGRLYRGDPRRTVFRTISSGDFLTEGPDPFDLVVLVDVVHHVPRAIRQSVLRDAGQLTAPEGTLIVKEWERGRGPAHYLAYAADRLVTGDPQVSFMTEAELTDLLVESLPDFEVRHTERIRPRHNNLLLGLGRRGFSG